MSEKLFYFGKMASAFEHEDRERKRRVSENKNLVIPEKLPIADLRDYDFEECVYWLFDAMGAKKLVWRKGSHGNKGTADGGRDIEAQLNLIQPNAEVIEEQWWIDPKGRKGTLEKSAVQDVLLNAQAFDELDVFVVATNTTFTNPTRDWVEEFQRKHPKPRIELWDGTDIERLLSKYPQVVARLFGKALSTQGKLEVLSSRFWDSGIYSDGEVLEDLWKARLELEINVHNVIALCACELANGDPHKRTWLALFDGEDLALCIINGFSNAFAIVNRLINRGAKQDPVISTLSHLIISASLFVDAETVQQLIYTGLTTEKGEDFPDNVRGYILLPVIYNSLDDLYWQCALECDKVCETGYRDEDHEKKFWQQFHYADAGDDEEDKRRLILQRTTVPCPLGLVSAEESCPLTGEDEPYSEEWLLDKLRTINVVSRARFAQQKFDSN